MIRKEREIGQSCALVFSIILNMGLLPFPLTIHGQASISNTFSASANVADYTMVATLHTHRSCVMHVM